MSEPVLIVFISMNTINFLSVTLRVGPVYFMTDFTNLITPVPFTMAEALCVLLSHTAKAKRELLTFCLAV